MIAIIHSIDLKWPYYVDSYLNISTQFGTTANVISLDCILQNYNIKEKSIHVKSLIAVLFPFVILLLIIGILVILKLITKRAQTHRIFISFIVMSIFLQPSIIQQLFDNLNYITLNNVSYLTKNLTTRYDDGSHQKWVFKFYYIINYFIFLGIFSCDPFFDFLDNYLSWLLFDISLYA